jgi:hypothetical protein
MTIARITIDERAISIVHAEQTRSPTGIRRFTRFSEGNHIIGGIQLMRICVGRFVTGLAILALAAPIWARPRTESTPLDLAPPAGWAGTQLKPGSYQLQAVQDQNQIKVVRDGKVVAQVPCQWIQLPKKAEFSEVIMTKNQITQIDFGGKTAAVQVK